jgi:hypothetical protein
MKLAHVRADSGGTIWRIEIARHRGDGFSSGQRANARVTSHRESGRRGLVIKLTH